MPIEIRELVIKTEIVSGIAEQTGEQSLEKLKKELLEMCKKMIVDNNKRNNQKR